MVDEKNMEDIVMLMRLCSLTLEERFQAEEMLGSGDIVLIDEMKEKLLETIKQKEQEYLEYKNKRISGQE